MNRSAWILLLSCIWGADARGLCSAELSPAIGHAIQTHCAHCHNAESRKGQLDLAEKNLNAVDQASLAFWIQVHDRVAAGEMPPPDESDWSPDQRQEFLKQLSMAVVQVDQSLRGQEGRVTRRRLNRYEYENTLRDLLDAPWLPIRQMLPEDGEAFRFNKVSEALDVSHVQIARYLAAADSALRAVKAKELEAPQVKVNRYYARDSRSFNRRVKFSVFNRSPERSTFPILGFSADLGVLEGTAPVTVGAAEPDRRAKEAMGVVASSYEPIEIRFDEFTAPESGRYKLRFNAFSFWAAPESEENWWRPSRSELAQGRTREPVSVYAEKLPRLLRKLGNFEVSPTPDVYEMEVQLLAGETIRPDAVRLFRSRPPGPWRNPLAERDGQPGVAFRWLEVEGPLLEQWPGAGHLLMFDDLPLAEVQGTVQVVSQAAAADAERLLRRFLARVYRQPVTHVDVEQFLPVIQHALSLGNSFEDAMLAGYSAVLCSPQFVTLAEPSGQLGDIELATRLAYFLWNSEPDQRLRQLAAENRLHEPEVLRAETERLLADGKSQRFVEGFLDYWLDLRKVDATSPDAVLYPDYYLDDYLVESAVDETRAFFAELIRSDLPARCIVQADFAMVNQRLAEHYGLADVTGVQIRKVPLPQPHVRGGLLTQASILKVTANGTTTSPVVRGAWITERILGKPIPPPPAAVPAVEPDTRGATTIREQLAKHRSLETCQGCHARIDPPGFALESFDVLGGWRQQYRVVPGEIATKRKLLDAPGFGKNGQPFDFQDGPAVDPSGMLPSGHGFQDIHDFRSALLEDERQIARNLVKQLMIYATGAEVRFSDRPAIEAVLDATSQQHYPVRELIQQIVTSRLFRQK